MTEQPSAFVGDIPTFYDRELGPNIFAGYAADIAARAQALRPSRTLELAAGTGIVSRKLRDGLNGELVVTDLNAPMLEVARAKFGADEALGFEVADAMALPYGDGWFDLIVCQFGVMFFPDKVASFRQALRVLKPGGRYLFNAWGAHADNAFARIAHETVRAFYPDNPPGFYRVPFSYADPNVVIADLKAAGFGAIGHEALALKSTIVDVDAFAHGLVFGNPLSAEIAQRGGDPGPIVAKIVERFRAECGDELALMAHVYSAARGG